MAFKAAHNFWNSAMSSVFSAAIVLAEGGCWLAFSAASSAMSAWRSTFRLSIAAWQAALGWGRHAVRTASSAQAEPAALEASRTADIHVLLSGQSIGWYGPLRPVAAVTDEEEEEGDATGQTDRLAS